MAGDMAREAVDIFHDAETLRAAADELLVSGSDRSNPSLLAGHRAIEHELGHIHDKLAALDDDPELARRACIGSDSRSEAEAVVIAGLAYVGAIGAPAPASTASASSQRAPACGTSVSASMIEIRSRWENETTVSSCLAYSYLYGNRRLDHRQDTPPSPHPITKNQL